MFRTINDVLERDLTMDDWCSFQTIYRSRQCLYNQFCDCRRKKDWALCAAQNAAGVFSWDSCFLALAHSLHGYICMNG